MRTDRGLSPPKDPRRGREPYRLATYEPLAPEGQAKVLVPFLSAGQSVRPAPGGRVPIGGGGENEWFMADPQGGTAQRWTPPAVEMPGVTPPAPVMISRDVSFTPDGAKIVFASSCLRRDAAGERTAQVIYACKADGSEVRLVTGLE